MHLDLDAVTLMVELAHSQAVIVHCICMSIALTWRLDDRLAPTPQNHGLMSTAAAAQSGLASSLRNVTTAVSMLNRWVKQTLCLTCRHS